MRPKTYLVLCLALTTVGASMLAWWQWQEVRALRAAGLSDNARASLEKRAFELERRNQQLRVEVEALRAQPNPAPDAAAGASAKEKARAASADLLAKLAAGDDRALDRLSNKGDDFEIISALADMPEFQKLLSTQARGQLAAKYAALFKRLNLPPYQAQKLQALLTDKQMTAFDVTLAVRNQGLTGKEAQVVASQLIKDNRSQIDASIKDLLGPQGYSQYQNYERTMPQRQTVEQLAQRLNYTSTPLNARQSELLVATLAQAIAAKPASQIYTGLPPAAAAPVLTSGLPPSLTSLGLTSTNLAPIPNAAVAKAQTFLSPPQVAFLRQMQQEQQAQQTLNQLLSGKSPKTGAAATPPPPPPKANPPKR